MTMGMDLELDAHLALGKAAGELSETARLLRRRPPTMQPVFYAPAGQIVVAGQLGFADVGGPDQGHFWYVRNVVAGGVTPGTVAAGVADLYVSSADLGGIAGADEPPLTAWRDRFAALPRSNFYGEGEMVVTAAEHLLVRFSGATNGQLYVAAARIVDYQEGPQGQDWSR